MNLPAATRSLVAAAWMSGLLLFAGGAEIASASDLKKLLMPGRVIHGHADVEDDCGACHDADSDRPNAALCTACHEGVGNDRASNQGFHGLFPAATRNECVTCHTDHEGRDADIAARDSGLFDHRWTDFPLAGVHLRTVCTDCHASGSDFRDAPTTCGDCHKEDDAHDGGLANACGTCHSSFDWQTTRFDHAVTGYSLTGRHADVVCTDCHTDNSFSSTPSRCVSCHAIDDVHNGTNGTACQDCHSTSSWRGIRFDHAAETGFALADSHAGLECGDCHRRDDFKDAFDNGCVDCHRVNDDHQGRNGDDCGSCHKPTEWRDSDFDHANTGFALDDAHGGLNCSSCHKAASADDVPAECGSCHAVDDSHDGQMGTACNDCHSQTNWLAPIRFDHDLSSFPLTGLHAAVACGGCHETNRFNDAPTDCASCHTVDPHEGALGDRCGECHTTNDWQSAVFDHELQTGFALDGGHDGLACTSCHRDVASNPGDVPSTCGGCHSSNDPHDGQFGSECGACHTTSSFQEVESLGGNP